MLVSIVLKVVFTHSANFRTILVGGTLLAGIIIIFTSAIATV